MRDLVLANQFKGANIVFATQTLLGNINYKIEENNYQIELLDSNDIEEMIELINKHSIDMIVIDNYDIDYNYEKELKEKTDIKLFVLDDTYKKHYCDILLNHNVCADEMKYKDLVPNWCELRCGAKYTLLREEFLEEKRKKKKSSSYKNNKNVFISMGGTDYSNKNIKILKVLEQFPNIQGHIVTTKANQHLTELKKYVKNKQNITLYINTNQIAKLMNKADFAIVTPSVTLNEVFYMELPFIAIKIAENQNCMYNYLVKNDYLVLEKFDSIKLNNKIEALFDSLKIQLLNFIDLSLNEKKMILKWRNNLNIRKWMFTQDKIELNDHLEYIESLKTKEDRLYFLVKKEAKAIGVIDFTNIDLKNKTAEFGVYTNPRIKGIGSLLMELIINYAFNVLKVGMLISEVFKENRSAIKLYSRYNFKETGIKKVNHQSILCMGLKK